MIEVDQAKVQPPRRLAWFRTVSRRFPFGEATGALGDLGTFVPIVLALVTLAGMDAATILVFAGLANIATGLFFRIPIPVQPMKAIAALAIAGVMTAGDVSLAGIVVGTSMLILASVKLIKRLDRVIPHSVVSGIQLAVGVRLAVKGLQLGLFDQAAQAIRPLWSPGSFAFLGAAGVMLLLPRSLRRWGTLGLILVGFVLAAVYQPALFGSLGVSVWRPQIIALDPSMAGAILRGAAAQIPLTILNSVLAVSLLVGRLFPEHAKRASSTKIAVSVGAMNLLACPFGAMPVCHGSGGLAGQYAFGARSGLSMVMLGIVKLLTGLLFGAVALAWMQAFPVTVLGIFLLLAAGALAQGSCFWQSKSAFVVATVTVGIYFITGFLVAGFVGGWIVHVALTWATRVRGRVNSRFVSLPSEGQTNEA